jgi:hypothetical protein
MNHRIAAMNDALSAALLGALIGYLAHGYWPELEWIIRTLTA